MDDFTCCVLRHAACWSCFSFLPASLLTRPRLETVDPSDIFFIRGGGDNRDDINVQLTFAILPRCIPRETKERREEDKCSGHSSISEPHLISAMPLLGFVSGTPELPLPPSLRLSLSLASGCGDGRRHGHRVLQPVKTLRLTGRVNTDFSARKQGRCCSPVGASSLFVVRGTKKTYVLT